MSRTLRVAIIGAGPAGTYAGDMLLKVAQKEGFDVRVDLIEQLPAPFGLVRYGVAPDHPRIKAIIRALHRVLENDDIRLIGNVEFGRDLTLEDAHRYYDALILATGSIRDAELDLPGVDLPGSYGAADFVAWYDAHPDFPETWDLTAREVAVIGNGNVALDIARMLSKHAEDLQATDIPAHVYEGLAHSAVTDVHVFGRRGPAQCKFTPMELRELGEVPDVDIVADPDDFQYDEGSLASLESHHQAKQVDKILKGYRDGSADSGSASRRLHLHFLEAPVEILGDSHVEGIRMERMRLDGDGGIEGTGETRDYRVQAVYRAIGYFGSPIPGIPFDEARGVIPNAGGRILHDDGRPATGLYTTGWIKRGPIGLIGSTKSDAMETVTNLAADRDRLTSWEADESADVLDLLRERDVRFTTWDGWLRLEQHEAEEGSAQGREKIKTVGRDTMVRLSTD